MNSKKLLKYGAIAAAAYFVITKVMPGASGSGASAVGAYTQQGSRHFVRRRMGTTQLLRPS